MFLFCSQVVISVAVLGDEVTGVGEDSVARIICWNIKCHTKNRFVSSLSYWLFYVLCCDSR